MELLLLVLIFFATSLVSVVTGSTSLVTVPAMLQFGIEPRSAIATNMFALTLMSIGGSFSFLGKRTIDRRRLPLLVVLTLAGSILGALLLLVIPSRAMPVLISVLIIAVALVSVVKRDMGVCEVEQEKSGISEAVGYVATFALGVYGGFFSGGYVTMLTIAFVCLFGMTFLQAVATTKFINVFSSLVATLVFMWRGLVDYQLGILLGVVMLVGAFIGGKVALRLTNKWLRRIFLAVVFVLALKTLFSALFSH